MDKYGNVLGKRRKRRETGYRHKSAARAGKSSLIYVSTLYTAGSATPAEW